MARADLDLETLVGQSAEFIHQMIRILGDQVASQARSTTRRSQHRLRTRRYKEGLLAAQQV